MKALIVKAPNQLEIIETPKPKVGPRDLLAKVSYCGICATDIAIVTGMSSFVEDGLVQYPVRIGHEWSGIVEEVGSEVTEFKPGDHVVADDGVPCLQCKTCLSGNYSFCPNGRSVGTVGNFWEGSFAEYMVMPAQIVYKLKPDTDLMEAACVEPACIAMHGVVKAQAKPGQKALVIGTGPIGLSAVGLLKAVGVTTVMMMGRRDSKLEYAKKMGADILINNTKQDPARIIAEETEGTGVDIVLETSGNPEAFKECLGYVRAGGKIALLGFYEKKLDGFDIDKVVLNAIDLVGVAGMPNVARAVIDLMESGRVSFKPLITSVYPFSRVKEAIQKVIENDGNRIKVIVEF
jgi:L-iditol 2-dehydrogenase